MATQIKTLHILNNDQLVTPDFDSTLRNQGFAVLRRSEVTTLQINVGKVCNQACHHCHVEAGPKRTEIMPPEIADRIINLLTASPSIETVDLTGGAPELNPNFTRLVLVSRALGRHVIDRCNLTVFFELGQEDLAGFLAGNKVEITASLPCYTDDNVDHQRGRGVFDKSIRALQVLNLLGYGKPGSGLILNLVYNPLGASLPPQQETLEAD
jgi:radical SAM/Cys-rich protein